MDDDDVRAICSGVKKNDILFFLLVCGNRVMQTTFRNPT